MTPLEVNCEITNEEFLGIEIMGFFMRLRGRDSETVAEMGQGTYNDLGHLGFNDPQILDGE